MPKNPTQSNKLKTPKLRFPGFEGVWEEKKLGEVAKFWNGKAHEQDISENGKYIVINSKFISQNGEVKKFSDKQISPLKKDDIAIVMSDIPNGKAIGKCFFVNENDKYTLNQRIGGIKSKEIISPFLYKILNRNKYFLRFDNGVSQTNLRKDEILRCPLKFPQLPEQQKIALFLGSVDEWVENLRSQKQNLEQYKKGIMQKIFPSTDSGQVPQVRFKDEKGKDFPDWEEKKLGSICLIKKGNQLNRDGLSVNTGHPVINGGVEPSGYTDTWNTKGNTITISEGGNSCGYVNFITEDFWCGGHCYSLLELKSNINQSFLFQYLKMTQKNIMRLRVGSGLPNIQKKDIEKLKLQIPSLSKQQKIADFLTSVDKSIESKQQRITLAENWKKGLMQGLFV